MRDLLTLAPSLPAVPSAPFSPMPPCGKYPESLSYDTEWFTLWDNCSIKRWLILLSTTEIERLTLSPFGPGVPAIPLSPGIPWRPGGPGSPGVPLGPGLP